MWSVYIYTLYMIKSKISNFFWKEPESKCFGFVDRKISVTLMAKAAIDNV